MANLSLIQKSIPLVYDRQEDDQAQDVQDGGCLQNNVEVLRGSNVLDGIVEVVQVQVKPNGVHAPGLHDDEECSVGGLCNG